MTPPARWRLPAGPGPAVLLFNLVILPSVFHGLLAGDTDVFYHLAGGRWMAEHGRVLDHETFSFTLPGEPWNNYYWLFEALLYRLYRLGGWPALIALRGVLHLATLNLLFLWCYRRAGGDRLVTLAVSLLAFGMYFPRGVNLRPHLFSYLFLVVALFLLERLWRRPRALEPWLPLLCVPWASLHGVEYPVLALAVGAYAAAALVPFSRTRVPDLLRDWRVLRWPALVALCAAGFLLNPFGWRVFASAGIGLDREVMRNIVEMRSVDWTELLTLFPYPSLTASVTMSYLLLLAVVALPGWIVRRDVRALVLAVGATTLALHKARFAAELAILVAGFVAEGLAGYRTRPGRLRWVGTLGLTAACAFMVIAAASTARTQGWEGLSRPVSGLLYPVGPVRFLERHGFDGNVFNDPGLGGYVDWAFYPRGRVAMDMRTPEPFNARLVWMIREILQESDGRAFGRFRARWPVDVVLLRRDAPLASRLRKAPEEGFVLVYADWGFVVLVPASRLVGGREGLTLRVLDPGDATLGYVEGLTSPAREALLGEARRLADVWPENHLAHQTELAVLLVERRYEEARTRAARLVLDGGPFEIRYRHALGLAWKGLGRYPEALAEFRAVTGQSPEFAEAYPALAETALALGRPREARRAMERLWALKEFLLTPAEYALLGNARYRDGRRREAVEAYERALWLADERHPDRPDMENNLGSAYVDLGRPERALPLLEAALARRRPFPEAELNRARAWAQLGRTEEARQVFRRLAEDEAVPAPVRARARERL